MAKQIEPPMQAPVDWPDRTWLSRLTLVQRLFVVGVCVAVVVAIVVIYITQSALQALENQIRGDRLSAARVAASSVDRILIHAIEELEDTAKALDGTLPASADASGSTWSSVLARHGLGMMSYVAVVDDTGRTVVTLSDTAGALPADLNTVIPSLGQELQGSTRFVSSAFIDPRDGSANIAIAVPFRGAEGDRPAVYVLGFVGNRAGLQEVVDAIVAKLKTGHADLLDNTSRVLVSTEATALTEGDHPRFYEVMRLSPSDVVVTVPHKESAYTPSNQNHVMAYVPLKTVPLALTVGASEAETFAVVQSFRTRIYWLAGTVLSLCLALALVGTMYFVRPVRSLAVAARRMAKGNLEEPIGLRDGGEIGMLASDMEQMRFHLKASLQQIGDMNRDLERRIEERTNESDRANRELVAASAIAEKVSSFMSLDEVLEATLEGVAQATGQESIAIFLLDSDAQKLRMRARRGLTGSLDTSDVSLAVGDCLCGQVALSGNTEIAADTRSHPLVTRPACPLAGFFSVAAFPLQSRERVEGVLSIFSPRPNHFAQQDFRVIELICHQVGIAIQNARMYEDLMEKERLAHQLLERILNAQEEERKRVARELHDETGQALTGISLALDSLKTELPVELQAQREKVQSLKTMATSAMAELRKLALDLRPSALDNLGLVPAVRRYALTHLEPQGMHVTVSSDGVDKVQDPAVQTLLFRVVQEAINNVARHSKAKNVSIRFWREGSKVWGSVSDDGVGFISSSSPKSSTSLGLVGMQERANLVGGHVWVESAPQKGTTVTVCMPEQAGGYAHDSTAAANAHSDR